MKISAIIIALQALPFSAGPFSTISIIIPI